MLVPSWKGENLGRFLAYPNVKIVGLMMYLYDLTRNIKHVLYYTIYIYIYIYVLYIYTCYIYIIIYYYVLLLLYCFSLIAWFTCSIRQVCSVGAVRPPQWSQPSAEHPKEWPSTSIWQRLAPRKNSFHGFSNW